MLERCVLDNSPAVSNVYNSFSRSTKDPGSLYESPYTTHTPSVTTKNNLLSNHPVKSDTQMNNLSVTNNGTLGKCKKVYI